MMRIIDELQNAASIAISGHTRPDGDCVGSVMGAPSTATTEVIIAIRGSLISPLMISASSRCTSQSHTV